MNNGVTHFSHSEGFNDWKKADEKIRLREKSSEHRKYIITICDLTRVKRRIYSELEEQCNKKTVLVRCSAQGSSGCEIVDRERTGTPRR